MLKAVLDTNVLVASLLNPKGTPSHVVRGFSERRWTLLISAEIMEEYEGVLRRPHLKLPSAATEALIAGIRRDAVTVLPRELVGACSDPDDDKFLSCALAGAASHWVMGNLRHFPKNAYQGIRIVSPAEFLSLLA